MRIWAWTLLVGLLLPVAPAVGDEVVPRPVGDLALEAEIPVSGYSMTFGSDALWLAGGKRLTRIDAASNAATEIPLPGARGSARGLAAGEGAIWVPSAGADQIFKVDPAANAVVLSFPARMVSPDSSVGIGEGSLWVVTQGMSDPVERTLTRFDAATGAVQARIALPAAGAGVAVSDGAVWVTAPISGELFKIDPATNTVAATVALGGSPRQIAAGEGALWVANQDPFAVQRVDPASGSIAATIPIPITEAAHGRHDIDVGGGFVWVSWGGEPLDQIDPATNSLVGRFVAPERGGAVRYGAGSVWLSGNTLSRLRPPAPAQAAR